MENPEVDRSTTVEDGNQLNRNRSFKSKQLVRSQAIRESTSPPRTISPSVRSDDSQRNAPARETDDFDCRHGKQRVEIQITSNTWEGDASAVRGNRRRGATGADLLSNNPRVACICGACAACPHCRGRRRRPKCPTKQDSGIVCSDECADYSDTEHNGTETKKHGSLDADEYYCRCAERKDKPKNISLSRNDSDDRTELLGPELVAFIKETLNKNARDRTALLKIEKELHCFINDTGRCIVKFPVMTSYGRMLVHRCAALFQLAHHLDQTNKTCVVVSKSGTCGGRIPCTSFKTWCVTNFPPSPMRHQPDPTHAKSILKRDNNSLDTNSGAEGSLARSKSLEQREKEYERVRRRIFSEDNCHHDESQWPWMAGPIKLLTPEPGRNKLLKVQSLENPPTGAPPGPGAAPAWRAAVSKSHSFGGYGDRPQRALSRQGDLASSSWRLSPSSSGYKTLSLRSTDSVTPSPTGGGTPEPGAQEPPALVWAVTDLAAVPHGALVIHPQTGRPLTNPDGSVYHFDPANPPVLYDPNVYMQTEHNKIDQNNEKRRGRLEKQHSFMDNENECQSSEDCRNKCCCECRKHEQTQNNEKTNEKQEPPKPPSPKPEPKPEPTHKEPEPNIQYHNQSNYDNQPRQEQYNAYTHYTEEAAVQQMNPYLHQEVPNMGIIPQAKVAPILQDPNIRPMSLTNVMYPPTMQPPYAPYITNQRMEQIPQPLYQPVMQPIEEPKQISSPPHDNTFRIDPSYPYPAVDYSGACGGCIETQPPRSFSVPYGQVEVPTAILPPPYPIHNVLHLPHYPVQYQEPVQWSGVQQTHKLYEMCPVVYPQTYPHYNVIYPQVVQQPYPICPPIYPVQEKEPHNTQYNRNNNYYNNNNRTSHQHTPRNTPGAEDKEKEDRQNNSEIAAKIQQIKDQMASLNTRQRPEPHRQWRRNTDNGILGNCPAYDVHTSRTHSSSEPQLSTAARAIVNSIRNMQARNTYHQPDKRSFDNRRRYDREQDKHNDRNNAPDRPDMSGRGEGDRKFERGRTQMQYRPPYLLRQMSPGTCYRRSPAPVHPLGLHPPRRGPPEPRPRR